MPGASPPELIGQSPLWLATLEHVSLAAQVERPILVIGERGSGKELVAERLHFLSPRWDKPFIKVNCAALSQDLLDSELFGHEAGAFTGAAKRRQGRFELADGGTLFLDEIATASMQVQEKLLRVVEYGEFQRLGGEDTLTADVRVVAATNVDLPARCADGRFRADLMDRLAFDVITMPPLRARPEDILLLATHFAERLARELEADFPGWTRAALEAMRTHAWSGNVRELKNTAERATFRALAAHANGAPYGPVEVTMEVLDPFSSPWRPRSDMGGPGGGPARPAEPAPRPDAQPVPSLGRALDTAVAAAEDARASRSVSFEAATRAFEQQLLEDALTAAKGHQGQAAERLGLSYHQLRGLLKKYNLGKRNSSDDAARSSTVDA